MTPGIHLLHKPVGPTSFELLQQFRQKLRPSDNTRLCHGGALDPFAKGLLLILVEPATRLFDQLHDIPKTYLATIQWGSETDNGDPLGQTVATGDASSLTPKRLEKALAPFLGWREQVPPNTSNKRIGGERAYTRAHRGEQFELPAVRNYLHEARWLEHDLPNQSTLAVTVRGGYYVRALARDLGRALGCRAHLAALHRTAIGPWSEPDPADPQTPVVAGHDLLPWLASRLLSDAEVNDLRQKRPITPGELLAPTWSPPNHFPLNDPASTPAAPLVRACYRDRLCFLLSHENGLLHPHTQLPRGA